MKDKTLPAKTTAWRGYTLDELLYERVISLTRIEIEKAKFLDAAETTAVRASLADGAEASKNELVRHV